MNRTLLLLTVIFITISCNKEEEDKEDNIRLKKIISSYELAGSNRTSSRLFHYNAQGRITTIERHTIAEDPTTNTKTETKGLTVLDYDANGRLIRNTYSANNKTLFYFTYYYNDKGQVAKMIHTLLDPGIAIQDHAFAYDGQGRLIADTGYASSSYFYHLRTYGYDDAGNTVTYGVGQKPSEEGDIVMSKEGYAKYDSKGNPFSLLDPGYHVLFDLLSGSLFNRNNPVESRGADSDVVETYENTYLPNGMLKEYTRRSSNNNVVKEWFEYESVN
jgi:YD repeat-containing protein